MDPRTSALSLGRIAWRGVYFDSYIKMTKSYKDSKNSRKCKNKYVRDIRQYVYGRLIRDEEQTSIDE